jgi:hypothetical protein
MEKRKLIMQDPFKVMNYLHQKLDRAVAEGDFNLSFDEEEIRMLQKALEYGTKEWWEELEDKEDSNA